MTCVRTAQGDMRLLDLSSNKLTLLPNMLVWRSEVSLRSIFIQNNLLVALPPEICRCQTLQDLRVSNNQLGDPCAPCIAAQSYACADVGFSLQRSFPRRSARWTR
jgi:hypothetical protein